MKDVATPQSKRNHTILRYPPLQRFRKMLIAERNYSPEYADYCVRRHHPEGQIYGVFS